MFILSEAQDAVSTATYTVTNETISAVTELGVGLATNSDCGFHDVSITEMGFEDNATEVASTDYSLDEDTGVITYIGTTATAPNNTDWNVSYTYLASSDTSSTTNACGSMNTANTGLGGMASWIAVIVVVLAAAVVLVIVISSFGRGSAV